MDFPPNEFIYTRLDLSQYKDCLSTHVNLNHKDTAVGTSHRYNLEFHNGKTTYIETVAFSTSSHVKYEKSRVLFLSDAEGHFVQMKCFITPNGD